MRTEQLAIHSLTTKHRNLEEALEAYSTAGFRYVEPYLPLVKAWLEDGHTVEETRALLDSLGLRIIASSELAVECFHASDVLLPNLRANAENVRLISELGGSAMIVHTDGPELVTPESLDPIARALVDLAEATEETDVDIAVEFNASPVVRSLQSGVRVAEIADHPRVGVLFDTAHYHVTPTKLSDINSDSVKWVKHVHLNDMPNTPADLTHRDFDRVLPGEGVLDLAGIISALERNGYGGFFAIELFNAGLWQLPTKEAARRCYESLLPLCEG
ncbi:TIM barrel protein [Rubrobacter tropicus]|uniref:TIM barrel protein n=1 Tax=Rubrobacter tropicus TaxID=2653851 RepID=A0A6G8QCV8_9ACTN|nr:TIM barrel protein [Rubrobacter tropicus]